MVLLLQVRILEESGQLPLAYVAAANHGLEGEAQRLLEVRHGVTRGTRFQRLSSTCSGLLQVIVWGLKA